MKSNGRAPSRSIIGACAALGLGALLLSPAVPVARASSHREAPLISQDPNADNTDLYAFVGPRSTPNYEALTAAAVTDLPGGIKVFAGQRDDPFFVDLGSVFDLAGLRPFNGAHLIPLDPGPGVDGVGGFNTHSIAIQVPIDQLTRNHRTPSGPDDPTAVIGVYASASRKRVRILRDDGTTRQEASWVQVSRLGEPLVNEVIIPPGTRGFWNRSDPADDAQFVPFYRSPELARGVNVLYGDKLVALGGAPARTTDRDDLVLIRLPGEPLRL